MHQLSRLYDPRRFKETRLRHARALRWEAQGRIPLGVHVVNPERLAGLSYQEWLDPAVYCALQTGMLADTLEVGSDVLPVIGLNHLGTAPLTSLFGAEQFMPEQVALEGNPWDIGPTPLPVYSSIEEVRDLAVPPVEGGLTPAILAMGRYYREHLPPWVALVGPMPSGPFSAAMELRGMDFLYDVVDTPEEAQKLLLVCAEAQVALELRYRREVGTPPGSMSTNFGVAGAGLRLGEDSICTLSPDLIARFCALAYRLVNRRFGGSGHIHFCTLPHSRFLQLYEALLRVPEVSVVSSQFAFEYYRDHLPQLRGRLAVESFYGQAVESVRAASGSFRAWAREFVAAYKNESGLVLYCTVPSVEEGKELWAAWEEAHER